MLSDEAGESSSLVTPTVTGASTITVALAPSLLLAAAIAADHAAWNLVHSRSRRFDPNALDCASRDHRCSTDGRGARPRCARHKRKRKFHDHDRRSLALGRQRNHQRLGLATVTAQLTNQNADVQVSACVAPANAPCQIFTIFSTPASFWKLETVGGSRQVVPTGQLFQPLIMRITDGSPAANPVMGVIFSFEDQSDS